MFFGATRVCHRHAFRRAVVGSTAPRSSAEPVVVVHDFTFSALDWRPGADELLIRNAFAALPSATTVDSRCTAHPSGPFYASGSTSTASVPHVPGTSGSGAVLSVGRALPSAAWLSQRVAYSMALARVPLRTRWEAAVGGHDGELARFACAHGACSSFLLVNEAAAVPVPASVTDEGAAVVAAYGLLAHYLVCDSYPVGPGSIVVVHAAAGGTGLLVCQMAKIRGAEMVIGICGGSEKAELAKRVGRADHVIDYKAVPDWPAAVRALLPPGRSGVNVIFAEANSLNRDAQSSASHEPSCLLPDSSPAVTADTVLVLHTESPLPSACAAAQPHVPAHAGVTTPARVVRTSLGDVVEALGVPAARACLADLLAQVGKKTLGVSVEKTWPLRKAEHAFAERRHSGGSGAVLINCVD